MEGRLVVDGNAVYEIEKNVLRKNRRKKKEKRTIRGKRESKSRIKAGTAAVLL